MTPAPRIASYAEFWPFYLSQHAQPLTRRMHVAGAVCGLTAAAVGAWLLGPWALLLGPVVAYAWAWSSHFWVEHNRPATFAYPWWSLISEFRMVYQICRGRL